MTHACSRWRIWAVVLLTATVGIAMMTDQPSGGASSSARSSFPSGDFESHLDGFVGKGHTEVALSARGAGRNGTRAMVVRTASGGPASTNSRRRYDNAHLARTRYVVRAWFRASAPSRVALRVRETVGGRTLHARKSGRVTVSPGGWTRVKVRIRARAKDSRFAIGIRSPLLRRSDRLLVDDLRMSRRRGAGVLTNGCRYSRRGIPGCGTYVGAAHGSNTDPSALEGKLGDHLGVRRTYFTGTGVDRAVTVAREDVQQGRVPWISFKLPYSWGDMAAGRGDSWARNLATRLAKVKGPVWLAFHHEPEGDGDIQAWRRMQQRLAPLVRRIAPNVAYTVVLTGWHEFYGDKQYRLANIWPRGVKVDVAGFDIYQQYGVVKDGQLTTRWTDFSEYYRKISAWARTQGVAWGLAETGVTDRAAKARPTEIPSAVAKMARHGGVAYTYFDTTLNSVAPWDLSPTIKRNAFGRALDGAPAVAP